MKIPRPYLAPLPLEQALAVLTGQAPADVVVTMSTGQWDPLLANAYESGCILLELDRNEQPVAAYQKAGRA